MVTKTEAFPSKYLRAGDLQGEPLVLKITRATFETLKNKGVEQSKVVLSFANTKKQLPLNQTNFDAIVDVTGEDDSDSWVGHEIEVFPTTTEMQGQTTDCIRIRKPGQSAPKRLVGDGDFDDAIPF